ncbi:MAG TPA: hypothetical protein VFW13_02140 [Phenylobacterium sp.]|nr:hypothetical protein [Phenylobacterium sp.]
MHLHISPEAPMLIRGAATTALALHVSGASMGVLSGAVALVARKGSRPHRVSGTVFFVSMLTMSGVAAIVAPLLPDRFSAVMGVFVFYLTATAWAVVRRRPGSVGRFETGAALVALGVVAANLTLAWIGGHMPKGALDGEPSQLGYLAGGMAMIAFACDVRMIRAGGLAGAPRIRRHLWRMCLALAIATGSFAGQPMAQPAFVRGSPYLFIPALIVLGLMVFWLIRFGRGATRKSQKMERARRLAPAQEVAT